MVRCMNLKDRKPLICNDIVWRRDGENKNIMSLASCKGGPIRFLNSVGGKIIELSDGKNKINDIINIILSSFEKTHSNLVEKDVINFLKFLIKEKIIKWND